MIMKLVFLALSITFFGTAVLSAPLDNAEQIKEYLANQQKDYLRDKRLDNSFYAISPCAAAGGVNTPVAPVVPGATYQGYAPLQARYVPNEYNYGYQDYSGHGYQDYSGHWYRSEDPYKDEREMMRYSDANFVDQAPMTNVFRTVPSAFVDINSGKNQIGLGGHLANHGGSAYGVFPNANVGGCNVPLLFSCTPSIATGHVVAPESHTPHISYGSPSPGIASPTDIYRGVNSHSQGVLSSQEDQTNDHSNPVSSNVPQPNKMA